MAEITREEFDELQTKVDAVDALLRDQFGDKPEGISQIISKSRTSGSVSVGGTIRVTTNQGEVDLLIK